MINFRGVEQLAARQAHNLKVAGSSPAPVTIPADSPVLCSPAQIFTPPFAIWAAFFRMSVFSIFAE